MPRQIAVAVENNFTRGLITEATGLKFPENACTETDNCIFDPSGLVSRRLGIDFENGYSSEAIPVTGNAIASYRWDNVAGNGDITFIVTQVGNTLRFYRVSEDSALSANLHSDTVDLTTFLSGTTTTHQSLEVQFSSGNGILIVTGKRLDQFYVEYDPDTDTISTTSFTIEIRDFEGDTTDTETTTSRPVTNEAGLSAAHRYNLENQGWSDANLGAWDTARTDMPSNADVAWYYKNTSDEFDFTKVDDYEVGNSHAPEGHFIYDVYNINRSSNVSGATNFSIDLERVTTSAFFAGRAFYSGLSAPLHNSRIYFSQILESLDQIGKCYQENDPTSELISDLLPSDGGVIDIIDAGTIYKMLPVLNSLIVFASNGVWAIQGSSGLGFTANDYSVAKLDDTRNISHTSFVLAEGLPFWWTLEGIYTLKRDQQTNSLNVVSITDSTIREFYKGIPSETKQYARGAYDPIDKVIQWIYKSTISDTFNQRYIFDRILTLNLISSSFSPWSISIDTVQTNSIVNVFGQSGSSAAANVVNGADNVVVGADQVIAFVGSSGSSGGLTSAMKYLVSYDNTGNHMTWAEEYRDSYLDWESLSPTNYDSNFTTGYKIRGDAIRKFQSNYIRVYTDNEQTSIFNLQSRWDYSISGDTGRWSVIQPQTVTMDSADLYGSRTKRLRLRGHGLILQLRFSSVEGEPFDIIGWVSQDSANAGI